MFNNPACPPSCISNTAKVMACAHYLCASTANVSLSPPSPPLPPLPFPLPLSLNARRDTIRATTRQLALITRWTPYSIMYCTSVVCLFICSFVLLLLFFVVVVVFVVIVLGFVVFVFVVGKRREGATLLITHWCRLTKNSIQLNTSLLSRVSYKNTHGMRLDDENIYATFTLANLRKRTNIKLARVHKTNGQYIKWLWSYFFYTQTPLKKKIKKASTAISSLHGDPRISRIHLNSHSESSFQLYSLKWREGGWGL